MSIISIAQGAGQPAALPFDMGIESGQSRVCASAPKIPMPGKGVFFRENIDLREPEGGLLTEWLLTAYDQVRPMQRKRGRDMLRLRLRRIASNALNTHFNHGNAAVLYLRAAAHPAYRDKPEYMRHGALAGVVDALVEAGLAESITGKKMPANSAKPSPASSYWATDDLIQIASACGVVRESIYQPIPTSELVRLYGPKQRAAFNPFTGRRGHPAKGDRIRFVPTDETQEWTAKLEAINSFYRQQAIDIADGASGSLDESGNPEGGEAAYLSRERFAVEMYRVFNDGTLAQPSFDRGGRLFGGWWMSVPSEQRRSITINGQPTVEIDYSACHLRMLYHELGLGGLEDPYSIPEIVALEAANGVPKDTYRDGVKWLLQILLNGRGRPDAVDQPDWAVLPPDVTRRELVACIKAHHDPIAHAFGTGVGLRLMRLESDIALDIVSTAMHEGWAVLPVHDSFITEQSRDVRLSELMIDCVSVRARGVIFGGDLGAAGGGACPTTSSFDLGGHRAHR